MLVTKLIKAVDSITDERKALEKRFLDARKELKRQLKKGADSSSLQRELAVIEAQYQAYNSITAQLEKCFS